MKYVNYIVGLVLLTFLGGCSKQLDQKPQEVPVFENFWQNEKDAQAGLAGCYSELRSAMLNNYGGLGYFAFGDAHAHIWDASDNGFLVTGIFQYQYNDASWANYYRTINVANLIIEKVPQIPDDKFSSTREKAKILGEAYFIRAYTYFYMTRIWGRVPLVLKTIKTAQEAIYEEVQSTEDSLLNQCLSDVGEASKLLNWGYENSSEFGVRANKGAAFALGAHIYMWRTRKNRKNIDVADYGRADALCDSIMTYGGYSLLDSSQYKEIFIGKSKEGIFELEFSVDNNEAYTNGSFVDFFLAKPLLPQGRDAPQAKFNPDFLSLFSSTDQRSRSVLYGFPDREKCMPTKIADLVFVDPNKRIYKGQDNIIVFRLADIILLRAEAQADMGNLQQAQFYLNMTRNRSGLIDDQSTTVRDVYFEIHKERLRELFMEGQALFDMVRMGFYDTFLGAGVYSSERYRGEGHFFPVNTSLILRNGKLKQTPYWAERIGG